MKRYAKIIGLFLVMTVLTSTPVFATEDNRDDVLVKSFSIYISQLFENPDRFRAIDMEENDISDQYYNDNIALYNSADFETLKERTDGIVKYLEELVYVSEEYITNGGIEPDGGIVNKSAHKAFACIVDDEVNYEAVIDLRGTYLYDSVNGIITSASNPTVYLDSYSHVTQGPCYLTNVTVSRYIAPSGSTVKFSTSFHLVREWLLGDVIAVFTGISITGDGNGLHSYIPSDGYAYPDYYL